MTSHSKKLALLSLVALGALGACDLTLEQLTVPPPGAVAELNHDCEEIELTRGAAMGIACSDLGDPCANSVVTVADPGIAEAHIAYSNNFVSDYNRSQATSFVLVGKREGETSVTVEADQGTLTYSVRVLSP